jgi:hypothetical protein
MVQNLPNSLFFLKTYQLVENFPYPEHIDTSGLPRGTPDSAGLDILCHYILPGV